MPFEVLQARKYNRLEVENLLSKYMRMTPNELKEVHESPYTPAMDLIIVNVIVKAAQNGDQFRMMFLLDRIIGKVPDKNPDESYKGVTFVDFIKIADEEIKKKAIK